MLDLTQCNILAVREEVEHHFKSHLVRAEGVSLGECLSRQRSTSSLWMANWKLLGEIVQEWKSLRNPPRCLHPTFQVPWLLQPEPWLSLTDIFWLSLKCEYYKSKDSTARVDLHTVHSRQSVWNETKRESQCTIPPILPRVICDSWIKMRTGKEPRWCFVSYWNILEFCSNIQLTSVNMLFSCVCFSSKKSASL